MYGVIIGFMLLCFALASWGYDPQRGFGGQARQLNKNFKYKVNC